MKFAKRYGPKVAVTLGPWLLRLLGATWRVRLVGEGFPGVKPDIKSCLYCFWHRDLLVPLYVFRGTRVVVMTSQHRDGQMSRAIMEHFGFETVSGSSTRGGARAMLQFFKIAREGRRICIPPDGPKGPPRVVKLGAVFFSSKMQIPIIPMAAIANRFWTLRTWDSMQIPKPFAKVVVHLGPQMHIPPKLKDDELTEWAGKLGESLEATRALAEGRFGAMFVNSVNVESANTIHASGNSSPAAGG